MGGANSIKSISKNVSFVLIELGIGGGMSQRLTLG
jgi:hypothetical protein